MNINIGRDFEHRTDQLTDDISKRICDLLSINPKSDVKECQYLYDRSMVTIKLSMKDHFMVRCSKERHNIAPGSTIVNVHPATSKEVPLLVLDMEQAAPDIAVVDYLKKFGNHPTSSTSEKILAKSGMWKGLPKGDQRFKVDISRQIMIMGTCHVISGRKVCILYPGNVPTCGICHTAGHKANACRDNYRIPVDLETHMQKLQNTLDSLNLEIQSQ